MPEPSWLRRWHERRWLWALLALSAALVIALGSLTPGDQMPRQMPWDKLNHFLGYAGLAGLLGLAGLRLGVAFLVAAAYGLGIEYLQLLVPGRSGGDGRDLLANALGRSPVPASFFFFAGFSCVNALLDTLTGLSRFVLALKRATFERFFEFCLSLVRYPSLASLTTRCLNGMKGLVPDFLLPLLR